MKWTASLVVDAIREAYGLDRGYLDQEEWSFLTEVPLRVPPVPPARTVNERTIDVFMVRNWASGIGHDRLAIEVKVSRSDYKNETPTKRAPAEAAAHRTVYAAPAGLIGPSTLPPGWGLIEVHDTVGAAVRSGGQRVGGVDTRSRCVWRTKATRRVPTCDLDYLVAAGFRRGSRAEEKIRRGESDAVQVPALRAEVESLAQALNRRDAAAVRDRARLRATYAQLAALGARDGHLCADCDEPVTYSVVRGEWEHADRATGRRCLDARQEAYRLGREAATGAAYLSGWADPVEPKGLRALRTTERAGSR